MGPALPITSGNHMREHAPGGGGRTGSTPQNNPTLARASRRFALGRSAGTRGQERKPAYC